jgi:NADH-quinone oxidoreductase subunit N
MLQLLNTLPMLGLLTPPETAEYSALLPGVVVSLAALLVVVLDVFHRTETSRDYLAYISAIGMAAGLFACWLLWGDSLPAPTFSGMVYLDKFGLFVGGLSCVAGMLAVLGSPGYLKASNMDRGEYYMLVLFAVAGMIFMANAADLLALFIALEVMSIPIYCIAAFMRKDGRSAEAGLKYFILGAFSTGLLLYGIALIYGLTGTTNLEFIALNLENILNDPAAFEASKEMLVLAIMLIMSGFAFKVAAVPFHIWTPDVYTGSPTPAVGFMATGVKAAAFAGMIRVFVGAFYEPVLRGGFFGMGWIDVLVVLAAASMVLGNLVAIAQDNVKRMLAYSSIAHAGYILVGVVAANAHPDFFLFNDAVLFYLVAYAFGTLGAFGALSYLRKKSGKPVETYDDLAGVGFEFPAVGLVMAICMFSSAGIPPTAGFLGKFYVFRAAVEVGAQTDEFAFIGLSILAVLTSIAGVYYYLRVLVYMYMRKGEGNVVALSSNGAMFALVAAAVMSLYIGILPDRTITLAREAVVDMKGAPASVQATIAKGKAALETKIEERAGDATP